MSIKLCTYDFTKTKLTLTLFYMCVYWTAVKIFMDTDICLNLDLGLYYKSMYAVIGLHNKMSQRLKSCNIIFNMHAQQVCT
jgi:hypothetical protein